MQAGRRCPGGSCLLGACRLPHYSTAAAAIASRVTATLRAPDGCSRSCAAAGPKDGSGSGSKCCKARREAAPPQPGSHRQMLATKPASGCPQPLDSTQQGKTPPIYRFGDAPTWLAPAPAPHKGLLRLPPRLLLLGGLPASRLERQAHTSVRCAQQVGGAEKSGAGLSRLAALLFRWRAAAPPEH